MKVRRLPIDPGVSGWNALLPERDAAVTLDRAITADWLIIGAGYAGLSAARRLHQIDPRSKIVVLDAVRVAEGPGGRNSGFMVDLPHDLTSSDYGGAVESDRTKIRANRRAIAFAAEMVDEFQMPSEAFEIKGKINAAASSKGEKHNVEYAEHLSNLGEKCEFLDAQQMQDITGSNYYVGGLFTPGCGVIQPAMYVRGFAGGLSDLGVKIFENSPVLALNRDKDWVAKTPNGQVSAPNVILAVNGHINNFGHAKNQLMHVFTYASMTRALSKAEVASLGGAKEWGLTPSDPLGSSIRRISGVGGDRIVIRNRFTYDATMEVPKGRVAAMGRTHDVSFAKRFPSLKGVDVDYRWGGRLCLSRNDVQLISQLDDGLFSACCQNGLGTAKGTLAGVLAVEMAHGIQTPELTAALAEDAPKRLPPRPLMNVAANAYLRWNEFRAGPEL